MTWMDPVSTPSKRQEIRLPELGEPISHYTDAVRFENLLFVSGCVGVDPLDGTFAPDVVLQTRQIFLNMGRILQAVGATFADVLKVTVFVTDINDRAIVNPVRKEFFGEHRPASTLVEISRFARPEAKIEIEAVVGIPG
jgi:2-iminobutanoate/2-iminopropanoate deaminase